MATEYENSLRTIIRTLRSELEFDTVDAVYHDSAGIRHERIVSCNKSIQDSVRRGQLRRIKQCEDSLRLELQRQVMRSLRIPVALTIPIMYSTHCISVYNDYVKHITSFTYIEHEIQKQQPGYVVPLAISSETTEDKVLYCHCSRAMAEMYLKLKNAHNPSFRYNRALDQHVGPYPDDSRREQSACELCCKYTIDNMDIMFNKDLIPLDCKCSVEMAEFYARNHLHRKYNPQTDYGVGPLPDGSTRAASDCVWCCQRDEFDVSNINGAASEFCLCTDEVSTAMRYNTMFRKKEKWDSSHDTAAMIPHRQCLKTMCRHCKPIHMYSPLQCPSCSTTSSKIFYFVFQSDITIYWMGCNCGRSTKFDVSDLPWSFPQWQQRCVAEIYCHIFHVKSPSDMCEEVMKNAWFDDSNMFVSNIVRHNQEIRREQSVKLYYQNKRRSITVSEQTALVSKMKLKTPTGKGCFRKLCVSCLVSNSNRFPRGVPEIRTLKKERSIYNIIKWKSVIETKQNKSQTLRCMMFMQIKGAIALEALRIWLLGIGTDPYSIVFFTTKDDITKALADMKSLADMPSCLCVPDQYFASSSND